MTRRLVGIAAVCSLLVPGTVHAQPAWDSPMLMPPGGADGFGLYLIEASGANLGVLGTWRAPSWNFGLRGGIVDDSNDDIGFLAGIDVSGGITRSTEEFPLDMDWVFGAGFGVSDGALISLPLGLSIGHLFEGQGNQFLPYVTPRVMLDARIDDDDEPGPDDPPQDDDDVNLRFAVDLGLDLRVTSAFLIRFGATVGDREAVAIGIVF